MSRFTIPQRVSPRGGGWSWLFLGLAAGSGIWVLGVQNGLSTWDGLPNTPLTTLLFLTAAAIRREVAARYQWSVVAGLGFSALGDAFLMQRPDFFMAGLGSFLVAHLCYVLAFTSDVRWMGHKVPFGAWAVVGIVLVTILWSGVGGSLRIPVVFYAVALLAMAAQAASRALTKRDTATLLAAVGAGLFVVSDSVLAFQRFRHPMVWGHVLVLGTYFAAQGGIALSVVMHQGRAD